MIYRHGQDGTAEVTLSGNPEDTAFGEGNAIEDGGCIEFEHVSFRYPGSNEWAVRDLSIRLEKGVHFAVVGRNGSGKTTFIKLLCRLYDPVEGRILLNGRDIREFSLRWCFRISSFLPCPSGRMWHPPWNTTRKR